MRPSTTKARSLFILNKPCGVTAPSKGPDRASPFEILSGGGVGLDGAGQRPAEAPYFSTVSDRPRYIPSNTLVPCAAAAIGNNRVVAAHSAFAISRIPRLPGL